MFCALWLVKKKENEKKMNQWRVRLDDFLKFCGHVLINADAVLRSFIEAGLISTESSRAMGRRI